MAQGQKVCFSLFTCLLWVALKRLRSWNSLHSSTKGRIKNRSRTGFSLSPKTTGSTNDDWPIQSSGPSICQNWSLEDLQVTRKTTGKTRPISTWYLTVRIFKVKYAGLNRFKIFERRELWQNQRALHNSGDGGLLKKNIHGKSWIRVHTCP